MWGKNSFNNIDYFGLIYIYILQGKADIADPFSKYVRILLNDFLISEIQCISVYLVLKFHNCFVQTYDSASAIPQDRIPPLTEVINYYALFSLFYTVSKIFA